MGRTDRRFGGAGPGACRAFTLLEVMLAVAIIALVGLSIFRFLELNLQAILFSTIREKEALSMEALIATVAAELQSLPDPQAQSGALLGETHRFKEQPSDEMLWVAGPGNGLFTRHAAGEYTVTLRLLPDEKGPLCTLGLRRMPLGEQGKEQNWVPLIEKVRALELRYFDPQVNEWQEEWRNTQARPRLVRVRIWRGDDVDAYEAILALSPAEAPHGGGPRTPGPRRPGTGLPPLEPNTPEPPPI